MDKVVNVYLLRHGKTVGPAALNGRTDVPVCSDTQTQIVDALNKDAIEFASIITSPLSRCRALAEKWHGLNSSIPYRIETRFQEFDFGDYDGKTFDELQPMWPQLSTFWSDPAHHTLPNAEQLQDFYERVSQGWLDLTTKIQDDTLVVCHGGTIRLILAHILNVDWSNPAWYSSLHIGNQSITHIKVTLSEPRLAHIQMIGNPLF
ncbi:histidine phosphatase family protein [Vibrio sp. YMD68]|uniref:histidine phosphatase family protein n=1 Tax=Vibrio sp. YMD68 TaxID=3042300 RepID=UPI00249BD0E6|nr:histidine phosphatase family protein [Vibrio sp. YMD68]WGV99073.1 histidine phosphatase family protein [Vibrio sp. YMD68]